MAEPVILAPKLDMAAATELMTTLQSRSQHDALVLDMTEVKHLGALCLQVLISAAKTAAAENRDFSIINVSDRVSDQLRVMGLTPDTLSGGCQ